MEENYILVDIRNSDDVFSKRFDGSKMTNFYNIPMNMIRFNKQSLESHLKYVDKIYIVCQSGKRSEFIKEKYFPKNDKIVVDSAIKFKNFTKPGEYTLKLADNTEITVHITGTFAFNLYNLTRIIQIMLGSIMIINSVLLWNNNKILAPLVIIFLFGCMAVYNAITNTCTLSLLLKNILN